MTTVHALFFKNLHCEAIFPIYFHLYLLGKHRTTLKSNMHYTWSFTFTLLVRTMKVLLKLRFFPDFSPNFHYRYFCNGKITM